MDVIGEFSELLKTSKSVDEATKAVKMEFASEMEDSDDGPVFWIALADVQWTFGQLQPEVLQRVKEDLESGTSLARWTEDKRGFALRKSALEKFILKLGAPNARPRKLPKLIVRAPKFRTGDCLSIRMPDGQFTAALVLVADHSRAEYGMNLIGELDYLSIDRPTLEVFRLRKWLIRTGGNWKGEKYIAWHTSPGFQKAKERIEVVGNIEVLASDPKDANIYSGWHLLGEQVVIQRSGDAKAN